MYKIQSYVKTLSGVLAFCLVFSITLSFMQRRDSVLLPVQAEATPVFVLDAGHGGEDGGASGVDGTLEKNLNLQIANTLGKLLEEAGYTVVYTRQEDKLLYTPEQDIKGKRKMYDLYNRLAIAEGQENPIFVSIHMNKFSDPQYSGLQVYYGENDPKSRRLAQMIQNKVKADLQPENRRVIKAGGKGIYLLQHATMPAVLVECGFLSHPEECQKLSEEDYQRRLSFSLFCAMIEYIEKEGEGL